MFHPTLLLILLTFLALTHAAPLLPAHTQRNVPSPSLHPRALAAPLCSTSPTTSPPIELILAYTCTTPITVPVDKACTNIHLAPKLTIDLCASGAVRTISCEQALDAVRSVVESCRSASRAGGKSGGRAAGEAGENGWVVRVNSVAK